jgi:hypothetical protein
LKALCRTWNLGQQGSESGLTKRLLAFHSNPCNIMYHKCLSTWFMTPVRSKAMKQGLENENNVLRGLMNFVREETRDTCRILKIASKGLLIHNLYYGLGASIDGVGIYENIEKGVSKMYEMVIEIKTHCTVSTKHYAERLVTVENPTMCSVNVAVDPAKFVELIPDGSHRMQLIHNAAVTSYNEVWYVEATLNHIIRVVAVIVDDATIDHYIKTVAGVYNRFFDWIQHPENQQVPKDIPESCFNQCPDLTTLVQHWHLWHALEIKVLNDDELLPKLKSITPTVIARYNANKGGVDVESRRVANLHNPWHNLKPEAVLWIRLFKFVLINALHISKWVYVSKMFESINSSDALNRAANRYCSTVKYVGLAALYFRSRAGGRDVDPIDTDAVNSPPIPIDVSSRYHRKRELAFTSAGGKKCA